MWQVINQPKHTEMVKHTSGHNGATVGSEGIMKIRCSSHSRKAWCTLQFTSEMQVEMSVPSTSHGSKATASQQDAGELDGGFLQSSLSFLLVTARNRVLAGLSCSTQNSLILLKSCWTSDLSRLAKLLLWLLAPPPPAPLQPKKNLPTQFLKRSQVTLQKFHLFTFACAFIRFCSLTALFNGIDDVIKPPADIISRHGD